MHSHAFLKNFKFKMFNLSRRPSLYLSDFAILLRLKSCFGEYLEELEYRVRRKSVLRP